MRATRTSLDPLDHRATLADRVLRGGVVILILGLLGSGALGWVGGESVRAQGVSSATTQATDQEIQELADQAKAAANRPKSPLAPTPGIDFLTLLVRGGWFMVPIAIVSLLVVTMALERAIGLRRNKILPRGLVRGLGQMAREAEMLEPRNAYRLCQQFPSAASVVIRNMLLKVGRPHAEIEKVVSDTCQREADRMYSNVRWLNFSAGVAPLLGLLGTVWGLIQAFHDTTSLGPSQNRAEYLAKGIYEALVTTLAGLMVAIPAAILSHYFEGRITHWFRQIEELMQHLLTQIESYEGRVRFEAVGKELALRSTESHRLSETGVPLADGSHASAHATAPPVVRTPPKVPTPHTVARKAP